MKCGESGSRETRGLPGAMAAMVSLSVVGLASTLVVGELQHQFMRLVIGILISIQ